MKDVVKFLTGKTRPYITVKVVYGIRNDEKVELMSVASNCMTKEEIILIAHKLIEDTRYNNWIIEYENRALKT